MAKRTNKGGGNKGGGQQEIPKDLLAKQLRGMDATWKGSKADAHETAQFKQGTTLGVGKHRCRVTEAKLVQVEDKNGKSIKALIEFTCVEGDEIGEKGAIFYNLNDQGMRFFQADLIKMGQPVDDIEDATGIPKLLADLKKEGPTVRLKVYTKDGYDNCRVEKLLAASEDDVVPTAADDSGGGGGGGDDDTNPPADTNDEGPEDDDDDGESPPDDDDAPPDDDGESPPDEEPAFSKNDPVTYKWEGKKRSAIFWEDKEDGTVKVWDKAKDVNKLRTVKIEDVTLKAK